ncbi:MAG TPA: lysine 5,6-aminomutase subunit alpha, partial [Candidatus Limnocylindrales bacterium]|nr:lysine 5,6-aminomutase subunit alpha [Candidatus Limnocylindrales bacterium]
MAGDLGPLDRLLEVAETLAGAYAARARTSTTVGRERALLRMFGVSGLDSAGRPLAWAVVDRYLAEGRGRLGGGIVLPFAMALAEYDLDPQRLALDVASGAVDLALEAALLREPDRRAIAEAEANRLIGAAVERIDANRTARSELIDVLGEPPRPWAGASIGEPDLAGALDEARLAVDAGADFLQVEVPIGRELSERLRRAGLDAPVWQPRAGRPSDPIDLLEQAPSGSQRALGGLRRALDEAAAQRRAYVRLGIVPPPLGTPESAVVAAFERIDLAVSDPLAEIVAGHVAPDRALADHAFGQGILARSGVIVAVGSGPLVVA